MTLSKERIQELKDKEELLDALYTAGVDDWEWYGDAVGEINQRKQKEEERVAICNHILEQIEEILCEGIDQPAGVGCGYGFMEGAQRDALDVLVKSKYIVVLEDSNDPR
jgi:hypothetical protein